MGDEMHLEAYALAANARHRLHVVRNDEPKALCGAGNLTRLTDMDRIDDAVDWPICERCHDAAEALEPSVEGDEWWWSAEEPVSSATAGSEQQS